MVGTLAATALACFLANWLYIKAIEGPQVRAALEAAGVTKVLVEPESALYVVSFHCCEIYI